MKQKVNQKKKKMNDSIMQKTLNSYTSLPKRLVAYYLSIKGKTKLTSSHLHGKRKMVSYTLCRSFSPPIVVVLCNEFPLYIAPKKYFHGECSIGYVPRREK